MTYQNNQLGDKNMKLTKEMEQYASKYDEYTLELVSDGEKWRIDIRVYSRFAATAIEGIGGCGETFDEAWEDLQNEAIKECGKLKT